MEQDKPVLINDKDLKFTPSSAFERHFEKLRHGLFRASLDHYLETGRLSGSALTTVNEMYTEFLETTDRLNNELEVALITRDGKLVNKVMSERIEKLGKALKQAKEALDVDEMRFILSQLQMLIEIVGLTALKPEWNRLSELITKSDEALETINKLI